MPVTLEERRRTFARREYEWWRQHSATMDAFWLKRAERAREALRLNIMGDKPEAYVRAAVAVAEEGHLMNQRYLLLMLLRTRAGGGV